jgi:hypothetical protein
MRKDSIDQAAIEAAYLIYNERGHKILDYTHEPTDYARNTVQEPERTSKLRDAFGELVPENVMDGGRYDAMKQEADGLNMRIDSLQNAMRISRQRGAFQQLQSQMKEMQALIKQKEGLDARMAVDNLGRKQMQDYDRTYDQESSYSETLHEMSSRIAELEAKLLEFTEGI